MPPRKKATQTLSAHIDESSEDSAGAEEVHQKKAPVKKASRKASTATEKKPAAAARGKKKPANKADEPVEDEEVDDPIEDDDGIQEIVVVKGKKAGAKPEPAKKEPVKRRGKKATAAEPESEEDGEQSEDEVVDVGEPKATKRGARKPTTERKDVPAVMILDKKKRMTKKERDAAAKEEVEREIAETQFTPMEVDPPAEENETEDEQEKEIAPTPTQVHQAGVKKGATGRKAPGGAVKGKGKGKKAGESEVEDETRIEEEEDDLAMSMNAPPVSIAPQARGKGRKQGTSGGGDKGEEYRELEKAFADLQTRYNNLREVKATEPERRLKEFQKNMKEKDEARDKLIASLRDDLKAQETFSSDTKVLQKKLSIKEAEISKLQTKVQELSKNLQDQQNENQMMSAKLVQAQNQLVQAQNQRNSAQVPGSAVKPGHRGPLGIPKGNVSAAAADDAWLARIKENLYADLCGLLILNVKKENDSNVFECVQTGVNGLAVHFKLSVPNQQVKPKKPPATQESNSADVDDTDENEIIFIPLFDEARDKTVMDILPTYLRDEISFQRDHMTKFYQKINSLFMMTISTQQQQESDSTEEESEEAEDDEDEEMEEEEGEKEK